MTNTPTKDAPIQDSSASHLVYRLPQPARAFAQLSRLDRPVGYWLLALPGWIGLAFASLSHGFASSDLKWAMLILIGAIAMRGAGCTYNDIVDQDLDAQVERTALRPLPAGTISTKQAWLWLFAQCAVGLIVLLCLPRLAQIISLCSIPLVAAYPFMKRITWWPQVWLGLTFNWAVLVAYAIKTGKISPTVIILYIGLMFWTVGYDTIYACQDIEDDAMIGVKSTARKFGPRLKAGITTAYAITITLVFTAIGMEIVRGANPGIDANLLARLARAQMLVPVLSTAVFFGASLLFQPMKLRSDVTNALSLFKFNRFSAFILIAGLLSLRMIWELN